VGNVVVHAQFEHFRVNHDQPAIVRCHPVEQREDHAVEADRLARAGGARDQEVRHRSEVGNDRVAGDILAEDQRQRHVLVGVSLAADQLREGHRFSLRVRKLDADDASSRDGRYAGGQRRHVAGNVVSELDHAARLDAAGGLQLIHGDHGSGTHLDDVAAHVEVLEHGLKQARITLQAGTIDLGSAFFGRRSEQVDRRELVIVAQRKALLGSGAGPLASARLSGGDWPGGLRDGDRRSRPGRGGVRWPILGHFGCPARSGDPRPGFAAEYTRHPCLLGRLQAQREITEKQACKREDHDGDEPDRTGDRLVADEFYPRVHAVRGAKPNRSTPPARQSGHCGRAGQAECNPDQNGASTGDKQRAKDPAGRL
jgi:hypothetical protein